jgi:hypothetical protein
VPDATAEPANIANDRAKPAVASLIVFEGCMLSIQPARN